MAKTRVNKNQVLAKCEVVNLQRVFVRFVLFLISVLCGPFLKFFLYLINEGNEHLNIDVEKFSIKKKGLYDVSAQRPLLKESSNAANFATANILYG